MGGSDRGFGVSGVLPFREDESQIAARFRQGFEELPHLRRDPDLGDTGHGSGLKFPTDTPVNPPGRDRNHHDRRRFRLAAPRLDGFAYGMPEQCFLERTLLSAVPRPQALGPGMRESSWPD